MSPRGFAGIAGKPVARIALACLCAMFLDRENKFTRSLLQVAEAGSVWEGAGSEMGLGRVVWEVKNGS